MHSMLMGFFFQIYMEHNMTAKFNDKGGLSVKQI